MNNGTTVRIREVRGHGLNGRIFLHSMPGRHEPYPAFVTTARQAGIDTIVCLTSEAELQEKSPDYFKAVSAGTYPTHSYRMCPIPDFGIPNTDTDLEEFRAAISDASVDLERGASILIHCGAGIGRTGMFTICLLRSCGRSLEEAWRCVIDAGSEPEDDDQIAFVEAWER